MMASLSLLSKGNTHRIFYRKWQKILYSYSPSQNIQTLTTTNEKSRLLKEVKVSNHNRKTIDSMYRIYNPTSIQHAWCSNTSSISSSASMNSSSASTNGSAETNYKIDESSPRLGITNNISEILQAGENTVLQSNPPRDADGEVSVETLMDNLPHFTDNATASDVSNLLLYTLGKQYTELQSSTHSWLQSNIHVSYVQLLIAEQIKSANKNITEHPNFPLLWDTILKHMAEYTNCELSNMLLSVLYLGIEHTDPLVHTILFQCRKQIPTFDLSCLSTMTQAWKSLQETDYITLPLMLNRHKDLLKSEDVVWEHKDALGMAVTLINAIKPSSEELVALSGARLMEIVENPKYIQDINHIGTYTRMARVVFLGPHGDKILIRNIIGKLAEACERNISSMQPHNIAELCPELRKTGCFNRHLQIAIEKHAEKFIDCDGLRLKDIANLMYAVSYHSSEDTKLKFENALYLKLLSDPIDVVLLSNIADSLNNLGHVRQDLLRIIQSYVIENVDQILKFMSRYIKIVKLLVKKRFINKDHEVKFAEKLLDHVSKQQGINMQTVSSVSTFILPNSRHALPEKFLHRLLLAIPKWGEPELYKLALGLNAMRQTITPQLRRQLAQIQNCLHMNIVEKVENTKSVDLLYQLALGLVIQNRNRDPGLTDKLMHMFLSFSKNLTDVSLMKTSYVFLSLKYYLPEIYDDLVNFVIEHQNNVDELKVLQVVTAAAQIGYRPKRFDEFCQVVLKKFHQALDTGSVRMALLYMKHLMMLEYFPDDELSHIFTMEFIEEIDRFIEEYPHFKIEIQRTMVNLNRTVVLEAPHLDVPWFQEEYCQENMVFAERTDGTFGSKFRNEIEEGLEDVLGSNKYYKRWLYSPYYHQINFECHLDGKNSPVPVDTIRRPNDKIQRVAILAMNEFCYCFHSKNLTGWELMKKRHLELLGYKVLDVPHFEWYSMGLSDWPSKVSYLMDKIMKR